VVIGADTLLGAGVKIIGDSHGPVRIGSRVQILENTVLPGNQQRAAGLLQAPTCDRPPRSIGETCRVEQSRDRGQRSQSVACNIGSDPDGNTFPGPRRPGAADRSAH
jgi:carbonic anhydrase/acetyltransferase-like protein (isoleucine patch superfamily)